MLKWKIGLVILWGSLMLISVYYNLEPVLGRLLRGSIFAVIILKLVQLEKANLSKLELVFVSLGKVSYAIYLIHNFVPGMLLGIKNLQYGIVFEFGCYLLVTIVLAYMLSYSIERPFRKIGNEISNKIWLNN